MSAFGIPELLVIAALVALPCLGLLIVGGIVIAVVLVVKNKNKNTP